MENHIQKLTIRQFSLYGKSILINTLILAKTTFLSNVFPIPEKIIQIIHTKHISTFMAKQNTRTNSEKNVIPT